MFEEESDIESWIENNQALNQIFSNDNYEEDEEDLFKVKDLNEQEKEKNFNKLLKFFEKAKSIDFEKPNINIFTVLLKLDKKSDKNSLIFRNSTQTLLIITPEFSASEFSSQLTTNIFLFVSKQKETKRKETNYVWEF